MPSSKAEAPRTLYCRVDETEWADSLVYGAHGKAEPTVVEGTRLRLQLHLEPTTHSITPPVKRIFRLVEPTQQTYRVSGLVREVAAKVLGKQIQKTVGYALLESSPPLVLVFGTPTARRHLPADSEALDHKYVTANGTLRASFYDGVFWNAPVVSPIETEVRAVRDGPWGSKVLEIRV